MPSCSLNGKIKRKIDMQIEICTNSFQSAKIAASCGIDRIELCQTLEVGGVTPSSGDIRLSVALKKEFDYKVYVLIRSRGGDFCYSEEDYEVMEQDVLFCKENGVDGIVIGGLTSSREIDIPGMKKLTAAAQGMGLTFHRAFDLVKNPYDAIEQIIDLGFERILTSGFKPTAIEGKEHLKKLIEIAGDRIAIMPGSGVNRNNVKDLLQFTGAQEIHFTGKELIKSPLDEMGSTLFDLDFYQTNRERVLEMKELIDQVF